jgi:ADP-ribose pyrophosphatase YjhB (NUDIX family)
MAKVEIQIDDTTWQDFLALCVRLGIDAPGGYLAQWLRHIVKHEAIAQGRYVPIVDAIVTRDESEILLVANQYAPDEPLRWSFPGGSVEPGEDLGQATIRELYEESGIEALALGNVAWVAQWYSGPENTGLLCFGFEVTSWRGEITLDNEERGGIVRRAEFVPYGEACKRLHGGMAVLLRDWLSAPRSAVRVYWIDERTGSGLQLIV